MPDIPEGGGVPPVNPAFNVGQKPRDDPRFQKAIPLTERAAPKADEDKSDGYSLVGITQAQAAVLLAEPLMGNPDTATHKNFPPLKTALGQVSRGEIPDALGEAYLHTAQQIVEGLRTGGMYSPGPGTTPKSIPLQQINDFNAKAQEFGAQRSPRVG